MVGNENVESMTTPSPLPLTTDGDPALPPGMNPAAIAADLADDGVSAPEPIAQRLVPKVKEAREQGVNINVVYYPGKNHQFTAPRNLAELLKNDVPGTIVVMNDWQTGVHTSTYARYIVETAERRMFKIPRYEKNEGDRQVAQVTVLVDTLEQQRTEWGSVIGGGISAVVVATLLIAVLIRRLLPPSTI